MISRLIDLVVIAVIQRVATLLWTAFRAALCRGPDPARLTLEGSYTFASLAEPLMRASPRDEDLGLSRRTRNERGSRSWASK